jgi:hypothetical protein
MKSIYTSAIAGEIISAALFFIHMNYKPLGSDFMFAILIIALLGSLFLFWQSFKSPAITGIQKTVGLICAGLPVLWLLLFIKQFI